MFFKFSKQRGNSDASVKNVKPEKIIEKIFYIYINAYMFFPYR